MTGQLLDTKLYPPPDRQGLILRQRLLSQLDYGLQCKLTLLSAPAGFGKTTLLAEWVNSISNQARVSWFSIDESDNDPGRFTDYFIATLQRSHPELVIPSLTPPVTTQPRFEPLLVPLLNKLKDIPLPVVLVLDDYHLIDEQSIHQAMDFLLDHQPDQFHLVLATRADPPLHLSRLRGRNQINEIRLTDLRFTIQESAAFLNQAMGLSLTPDQIESLFSRTEGWIAGLQLAGLSLRGQENPARFVQTFTGSTHFILDYLTDEVFQLQPADIQEFLLQTAVLTRLSGPLCDAVCQIGPGGSQKILDYLEHANLFILPLDDQRKWYRYHQLFADLLQQRLFEERSGLAPGLYRRASDWCEQNDYPSEAIEYAFLSGDLERAADLIETISQGLLMHGKAATLLRWLERLPPHVLENRLSLTVDYAWALLFCNRPMESIRLCFERVERRAAGSATEPLSEASPFVIRMLPLRAMLMLYRGQPEQALKMAAQALELLDAEDVYLRGVADLVRAISISSGDDPLQGYWAFQQAAAAGEKAGNLLVSVLALVSLAENEKKLGLLHQTQAHLEQALQLAVDAQGHRLPIAGRVLVGLGDLAREWNDLEQARRLTQEGIDLFEQSELVGAFQGYQVLARIEHARGNVTASRQAIQRAWHWAQAFDASTLDDLVVTLLETRLAILQGDLETACRWATERGLLGDDSPSLDTVGMDDYLWRMRKYELVVLARLWLAQGQPERTLPLLNTLFTEFERVNRPWVMIEIRLLQALACQALREEKKALVHIEQAISLAEPEGYTRTFLDEGASVIALLRQAAARPAGGRPATITAYLQRLLAAAGEPAAPPPTTTPASPLLIGPLTAREMGVLRLLESSLSAAEIAAELVISPSTVRTHIKSIYAKLDVHNRYQAVARAKALKLI